MSHLIKQYKNTNFENKSVIIWWKQIPSYASHNKNTFNISYENNTKLILKKGSLINA